MFEVIRANPGKTGAAFVAAMAAIAMPYTSHWEGFRPNPYRDIGGKWTVCYGETRVEMKAYTKAECQAMLTKALASDYGAAVLKCVPTLPENIYAGAALTDAAYNAGAAAACRSPMARLFRERRWREGCEAFKGWYVTVSKKFVRGLANRRTDDVEWSERSLCMKGAAA